MTPINIRIRRNFAGEQLDLTWNDDAFELYDSDMVLIASGENPHRISEYALECGASGVRWDEKASMRSG